MIRVMIAEDEAPLLRGIKTMIEGVDEEFKVVYSAQNGREAIDYLSQHDVDVVFTDINMPVIDGIQLIAFINEKKADIRTVIISGYNEFEYARSAIRYGAKNYLLKPIERQELVQVILELKQEIGKQSYLQKRETLISLLFDSEKTGAASQEWGALRVAYLCAGSRQRADALEAPPAPDFWLDDALMTYLRSAVSTSGNAWLFWGYSPNDALLVIEDAPEFSFHELLQSLRKLMRDETPVTILTSCQTDDATELPQIARRLYSRLPRLAVFAKSCLFTSDGEPPEFTLSPSVLGRLQLAAQRKNFQECSLILQSLRETFSGAELTQHQLEITLEKIFSTLQSELGLEDWRVIHQTVAELIGENSDYDTLFRDITTLCGDLFQNNVFTTSDKEGLMKTVDEYILQNISSPLSTKELSHRFGLVAPYLSKLFKAYKGMSPVQYIQDIRIENAKKLLVECPKMLSKDIAEALGYTNALYFSKVFRKNVGVYPSEYKNMHKE